MTTTAHNSHPDSTNLIHSDGAERFGFTGALVPGVTLWAILLRAVTDELGTEWLGHAQTEVSFRRPVYDGDQVQVSVERTDAGELGVQLVGADDHVRVACTACPIRSDTAPLADSIPRGEPRTTLPEATPQALRAHPVLAEYVIDTSQDAQDDALSRLREADPVYRSVLHPAILAVLPSWLMAENFVQRGPVVLGSMTTRQYRPVGVGESLTARARVNEVWNRRGNDWNRVEMSVLDAHDEVAMWVQTESIFKIATKQ